MTPEQKAALDKIKKLLRMKRGGTQHEAETAEALAAAIAAKNNIDLGRVSVDDAPSAESPITHREIGTWGNSLPCEARNAGLICQGFFNVSSLNEKGWISRLVFIGREHDLDIAGYVFKFLLREFRWQWNHKRGRVRNRKGFMWGLYVGLHTKLRERFPKPEGEGIVLHEQAKREAYIEEEFGETTKSDAAPKQQGRATENGYRRGREIEIRPAIKPGATAHKPTALPSSERKLLQPSSGQLGLL